MKSGKLFQLNVNKKEVTNYLSRNWCNTKLPTICILFLKHKKRITYGGNRMIRKGRSRANKAEKWLIRLVWRKIWTILDNTHFYRYQQIALLIISFVFTLNPCDIYWSFNTIIITNYNYHYYHHYTTTTNTNDNNNRNSYDMIRSLISTII